MATFRLDISYDGTRFRGWARQEGQRTVQGVLEEALATVLRQPVRLTVAGRTDAGVHALAQVASFELDGEVPERLERSLNGVGPDDVAVHAVTRMPDGFDARRHATSRTYRYRVLARPTPSPFEVGRALWWSWPLDRSLLAACAAALEGTHDFTAFTPTETEHVRFERDVLLAEWREERDGELLELWVTGDAFMRNMVRTLVGTMLEVGGGRRALDDFVRLLDGAPRPEAGPTAPAHGLYLAGIEYPEPLGAPRPF